MQIVIGTAGHIDHGKTALVKALTGTDTDSLAEEKARGMTIDLGFAYLDKFITIIDVPGHEKFIRNIVAGVSTIDIALLVVAADDGIMPQTKEHLHILKLLGLKKGIIAITKTDLINDLDWIDLIELELRELVSNTFLKDAPIFRTSVVKNEGINAYTMINFEMIGVPREEGKPMAYMSGYNRSNFATTLNQYAGQEVVGFFDKAKEMNLFMRSDNFPFYKALGIPAHAISTFDFTNFDYYHHVDDEADKMDYEHMTNFINKMIPSLEGMMNASTKEVTLNDE